MQPFNDYRLTPYSSFAGSSFSQLFGTRWSTASFCYISKTVAGAFSTKLLCLYQRRSFVTSASDYTEKLSPVQSQLSCIHFNLVLVYYFASFGNIATGREVNLVSDISK